MSPAIAALAALKSHLETITVSNGYETDVAAVAIGRAALAIGTKADLPVITLTTIRDDPANGPVEAALEHQTWMREVALEILAGEADGWESALDTALHDVRRALTRYSRPLTLVAVSFLPPADGGTYARVVLQLTYQYTVDFPV